MFKRNTIAVFLLALVFALPRPTPAAPPPDSVKNLDATLETIRKKQKPPALVAAVVKSGKTIAIGASGTRASGSKERVNINDQFHLGSCTKSMTATLCAMLVEEGKLKWDSTVSSVFPKLSDKLDAKFRNVTLEQLLCHRSGLPEDRTPDIVIFPKLLMLTGELPAQRLELLQLVMGRPPATEPGTTYAYANFGFAIAGAMAESVTGESYESLIKRRLFDSLGMKTAGFGAPGDAKAVSQPRGHRKIFLGSTPIEPGPGSDNPQVIAPAGTVHCSIGDWAKYAALHLDAANGKPRLLKAATFDKLHSDPFKQGYGFGWLSVEKEWAGGRILAHDGSNGMWYAVIVIAPKKDIAFVVATNSASEGAIETCRKTGEQLRKEFLP